jgi:hypothetical protein
MAETEKRFSATVDQVEGDTVVLDVDGEPVRLPRSFLPGAVREGAGYTLTIAASPETERALAQSVADRLRALTGKPPSKP